MPKEPAGRDLPVQKLREKPVFVFQGKALEVERYSDLGNGVYWFVAEEMPEYGKAEEVKHG
ncbi:MAG: hypothetical protein LBB98_02580 [Treponema sp.]|jgi:hypothetical protein|nr:hypothetical protein [Treponema sp.]